MTISSVFILFLYVFLFMMLYGSFLYFLVKHPRVFIGVGMIILLPVTIVGGILYFIFKDEKELI